jgi:hypothetical protein
MTMQRHGSMSKQTEDDATWVAGEIAGCRFHDARLGKRLSSLLHQLGGSIGATIPFACQDWANTKAAYRFLQDDDVDEQNILAGHLQATRDRAQAISGPLLILQDTTEFSYKRDKPELIGFKGKTYSRRDDAGRLRQHTTCGILMHSSLAVTAQGLPLGLCAIKFWSRDKFKGTAALKSKINPTRVPIEEKESVKWLLNLRQSTALIDDPRRCVHIGDRESDIYELFSLADELGLVSWCAPASIGWPVTAITRSPTRWPTSTCKACIASSSATSVGSPAKPPWRSGTGKSACCRPSANRSCIRPWS